MAQASTAFLFLDSFDAPGTPAAGVQIALAPIMPAITTMDVDAAREEGYRRGRMDTAANDAVLIKATLAAIAGSLQDATERVASIAEASAVGLARVVVAAVCAACPSLRARFGEPAVIELVQTILPGLAREPVAMIKVHPSLAAAVALAVAEHPGRLDIVPHETMPPGDVVVSWTDGFASSRFEDVRREIGKALEALSPPPEQHAQPLNMMQG